MPPMCSRRSGPYLQAPLFVYRPKIQIVLLAEQLCS